MLLKPKDAPRRLAVEAHHVAPGMADPLFIVFPSYSKEDLDAVVKHMGNLLLVGDGALAVNSTPLFAHMCLSLHRESHLREPQPAKKLQRPYHMSLISGATA